MEDNNYPIGTSKEYIKSVKGLYNYSIGNRDKALFLNPSERRYSYNPEAYSGIKAPGIGEAYFLSDTKNENNEFIDKIGGLVGYTFQGGYLTRGNYKVISNFEDVEKHQKEMYYHTLNPFNRIQKPYYEKHDFKDNIKFLYYTDLKYSPITFDLSYLDRLFNYYTKEREINIYGNNSSFGEFNPVRHFVNEYNQQNTYVDSKNPESDYTINKESVYNNGLSIDNNYKNGSDTWEGNDNGVYNEDNKLNVFGNKNNGTTLFEIGKEENQSYLLNKTNKLFKDGKIKSLINRFYGKTENDGTNKKSQIQSSVSSYGVSKGRNLLKETNEKESYLGDYTNPYCRVWTVANQYGRLDTTIRPFINNNTTDLDKKIGIGLRPFSKNEIRNNTALQSNGLPMVAPIGNNRKENIKKCMFSIENLAWRDIDFSKSVNRNGQKYGKVLSEEQVGPNGGRIMWFPPYNLKFSENVGVNWNGNSFIGRGEQIYTYVNTERSGQLEFTLLIDHPSVLDVFTKKVKKGDNSEDEKILRFFAGCGELEGSTTSVISEDSNQNTDLSESSENIETIPSGNEYTVKKTMYVFFPNNYSGIDDAAFNYKNAIDYLLSGGSSKQGYEGGNGALNCEPIDECIDREHIDCINKRNTVNNWFYEVDTRVQDEYLGTTDNYKDLKCFSLNSPKLLEIIKKDSEGKLSKEGKIVRDILNISEDIENDELEKEIIPFSKIKNIRDSFKIDINGKKVDLLEKGKVSIVSAGFASKHGYAKSNQILASNRATTIQEYLINQMHFERDSFMQPKVFNSEISTNGNGISSLEAKSGRHARVDFVVTYKDEEPILNTISGGIAVSESGNSLNNTNESSGTTNNNIYTSAQTVERIDIEYDTELEYFNEINANEDIVKKAIIEKVQYFDPAFHSITPEGFGARLTFLHQCTRQGPTIAASDSTNTLTAGNLAFGRPPVCVLRIGDFYNTRIIIDSVTINYDNNGGVQWDMNPEGIGLQPMFANVTIGFKFIGGSDLSGPISRLQNAVSYNYYANTSLYDRHADYRTNMVDAKEWENQKSEVNEWRIKDKILNN